MKKITKSLGLFVLFTVIGFSITGCAGFFIFGGSRVVIRSDNNLSSVCLGGTLRFTATGRDIVWIVSSTSDGTGPVSPGTIINSNGVLIVSINETYIIIYVIATSTSSGESETKPIRVVNVTGVTVSPSNQSIIAGRSQQFNASVSGTNNPDNAVTWRVSSNSAGTGAVTQGTSINANGALTIADRETLPTLYVIATSVVDPSKSGNANINILIPTVTGVAVIPSNQSVTTDRTLQFSASVTGTNSPSQNVTWRVSSNSAGAGAVASGTRIAANGLLTIAANETSTTLYVTATSSFDPTKSGTVLLNVLVPVVTGVAVSPANQSITTGRNMQFTASVIGTNNPSNAVTWKVSSNSAGTGSVMQGTGINANGVLTVAVNETATTLFIIATSVADPTKSGSVIANVIIPTVTGVAVSPANQSVERGRTLQFNAAVTGSNNPSNAVTWKVSSNAAGTGAVSSGTSINVNGLLTISANETAATLYVIATSTVDTTKSGSTMVTITRNDTNNSNQQRPGTGQNQPGIGSNQGQNRPGQNQSGQNRPGQNQSGQNRPGQNQPVTPTVTSVTVSPANQSVERGRTLQFRASVTGSNNPSNAVTWKVSSNAAGTGAVSSGTSINANGVLTVASNETAATLYIIATSTADTTKSGSVTVTVIRSNNGNQNSQGQNQNSQGQNQQ